MSDLSEFINGSGKRSRIVSGNSSTIPDSQSLTVSPATDEFVVLWGDVIRSTGVAISATGRGAVSLSHSDAQDGEVPIVFGLGEEVVISNSSGSAKSYSYRIYEEYK